MSTIEHAFQEFIDALQTADDQLSLEKAAARVSRRLGFRWFAYLRIVENAPKLISSYPKSWTSRYFDLNYQQVDPVVQRARLDHSLSGWTSAGQSVGNREQRRFFEEATTFGIKSGVTVPIRGGFGRMAAFTFAADDRTIRAERLSASSRDVLHLIGLYFHADVIARSDLSPERPASRTGSNMRPIEDAAL